VAKIRKGWVKDFYFYKVFKVSSIIKGWRGFNSDFVKEKKRKEKKRKVNHARLKTN